MPWTVTADPERFEEALLWFMQRTVLSSDEAARTDLETRQRSFWIGGGLQLAQVQRVFDEITRSLEDGEPFEEFRKRVRPILKSPVHAETVFRNATQRSYNAGRYRQMKEPSVARFRPYWLYDSILDGRTSPTCKTRHGTLLPQDHEWWNGNIPPLHHRCRSSLRNLRRSEAEKRGITKVPPVIPSTEGWGLAPDHQPIWKPDKKKNDPELVAELDKKKAAADKKTAPKPAKNKPEHSPKFWLKEYEHLGEAAAPAAYGRAMLERGLDRTPAEFLAEVERLQKAGHPSFEHLPPLSDVRALPQNRPLRDSAVTANHPRRRSLIAFTEHTRTITPYTEFSAGNGGSARDVPELAARIEQAEKFYRLSLAKSVRAPGDWHIDLVPGVRPYAAFELRNDGRDAGRIAVDASTPAIIFVHELAHAIEFEDARAIARSRAFLLARKGTEERSRLRDIDPLKRDFKEDEVGWADEFFDVYLGKDYGASATEVTSIGYERIMGRLQGFVRDAHRTADEETLFFLLGQLAGE